MPQCRLGLEEIFFIIVFLHKEVGWLFPTARALHPLIEPNYASFKGSVWLLIDSSSFTSNIHIPTQSLIFELRKIGGSTS